MALGGVSLQIKMHDRQLDRMLRQSTARGLQRAGAFYYSKCRQAVSRPNTGTRRKRTRGKGQYTVYDHPSQPGEPPRLRTGQGRDETVYGYNGNKDDPIVRVGVTRKGIYMLYLELGTRRIQPRPWLLATLKQFRDMIGRLAVTGGGGQ
jgi:hypothetical protein